MSIEVFDAASRARRWAESHADALIETAVSYGALDWDLKPTAWGMAFEVAFPSDVDWKAFRHSDAVERIFADTPDPRTLLEYRGRSLDGGTSAPRKKKPKSGAGGALLSLPVERIAAIDSLEALLSSVIVDRRTLTSNTQ